MAKKRSAAEFTATIEFRPTSAVITVPGSDPYQARQKLYAGGFQCSVVSVGNGQYGLSVPIQETKSNDFFEKVSRLLGRTPFPKPA